MKKAFVLLLTALIILGVVGCAVKDNSYTSKPTNDNTNSTVTSNDEASSIPQAPSNGSNVSESDQNSSIITPPSIDNSYEPYNSNTTGNGQVINPSINNGGELGPSLEVTPSNDYDPYPFMANKAINNCIKYNNKVTMSVLKDYIDNYAKSYNSYYTDSLYSLAVTTNGKKIVYNFTAKFDITSGSQGNETFYKMVFENSVKSTNKAFYTDQVKKYKSALSTISGIEFKLKTKTGKIVTSFTIT